MPSEFINQLAHRVLVFDGAMGTSLHKVELDLVRDYCNCENCVDILAQTRPDVVQKIHESFLEVGADPPPAVAKKIDETFLGCAAAPVEPASSGAPRHVLAEFDLQDRCFALN